MSESRAIHPLDFVDAVLLKAQHLGNENAHVAMEILRQIVEREQAQAAAKNGVSIDFYRAALRRIGERLGVDYRPDANRSGSEATA